MALNLAEIYTKQKNHKTLARIQVDKVDDLLQSERWIETKIDELIAQIKSDIVNYRLQLCYEIAYPIASPFTELFRDKMQERLIDCGFGGFEVGSQVPIKDRLAVIQLRIQSKL